jgi:hypothetical protein
MKSVNARDDEAPISLLEYVIGRLGRRVRKNPDDDQGKWCMPHQYHPSVPSRMEQARVNHVEATWK